MVTVQKVFDAAIALINEQAQGSGSTLHADTRDYEQRCIPIINTILPQLYLYSDERETPSGRRPVCPMLFANDGGGDPDLMQDVPLDDTLCLGVLPYALASHFVADENAELSAWLMNRYYQVFSDVRSAIPARFEPIPTPYGLF